MINLRYFGHKTQFGRPMRIVNDSLEDVALSALRPHPRKGDVAAIGRSIDANGFYGAIVAQKSTGHILVGNHRFEAAKQAGAESVPVLWVDVEDEAALCILLADNRTNDLAGYDEPALAELLEELEKVGSLANTGYDAHDLDRLLCQLREAVEAADAQAATLPSRYEIVVVCGDEGEQKNLLDEFRERGLSCRALVG